jgi:acyl-CoA synthetase (AMP-forming)/AMP-acid ligase II
MANGITMTYRSWDDRASSVARRLVEAGVARGERVALLVANEDAPIYQVAYFAVLRAGGVAVPINPRMSRREVEHLVADSGARAIVAGASELDRVRELPGGVAGDLIIIGPGAHGAEELDWNEAISGDSSPFQVAVQPDDVADILYTSGTTGLPKGVAATHRSAMVAHPLTPIATGGKLLHAVPLATLIGTHGTQTLCLRLALTNLMLPSFDPARFADLVATQRPEWTIMVPAHALLLLESNALEGVDTSCLTMVIYGSAPMPDHAVQWLADTFPKAALMNGYGLTEGGTSVVAMPPGEALKRPGSVGRPLDRKGIRVIDEHGESVPVDVVGEVAIRVPPGQRFYFNDPEGTAATWQGEWVHSGDLGYLDSDGYLYLVDRKKDLIVRGGYNVSSIEVESALCEHPDVLEAAVIGIPHAVLGQDVAAVVRLRPGTTLDVAEVRAFLSDRVADYKAPRHLDSVTQPLPRNAMGKLDKVALRQRVTTTQTRAVGAPTDGPAPQDDPARPRRTTEEDR